MGATPYEPVRFEPNRGQADLQFQFVARTHGSVALIGDKAIVLARSSAAATVRFTIEFDGANPSADWQTADPQPGATSYILGNRPERWLIGLPHFGRIVRRNLYEGIDLVLYSRDGNLEYDLVLHPGADPRRICLRFSGERSLSMDGAGNLIVELGSSRIVQRKPAVYEIASDGSHRPVEGSLQIVGPHLAAFRIRGRNPSRSLVVDPVILSASYLGASGDDRIIASDPRSLIIGTTTSADFPGIDTATHRGTDIFVYNPATQSTNIIGGSGDDIVTCARITGTYAWIGGYTNSRDLPLPATFYRADYYPGPPQPDYGGGDWDGFVMALQNGLPYFGTYLGGSGDDRVLGIDSVPYDSGFAAVGSTTSTDFPLANAWESAAGGGTDGFLTVMTGQGIFAVSTYLGGSGDDRALAVAVSGSDIYLSGVTASQDWSTPGSWSGTRSGPTDGFLLHASANNGWTPAQGLYFGGSGDDRINAIAAMPNGNVAVAGATSSPDLTFPSAFQPAYGGGDSDAFVAQFSGNLQSLVQGSFVGGSGADEALALATTSFDELLIGGWTNSTDFPTSGGASLSPCGNGPSDGFIVHVDSAGQPVYSACYGGSGTDRITSVASDSAQNDFFAGVTDSPDLPLRNPVQTANAGGIDGFFATLAAPLIHAEGLTVGKDLAAPLVAVLGDPSNYVGTPLTLTSGDPTQVLVGTQPDDPGQPSATISASSDSAFTTRRALIYCLSDSANVPLTLAAPGYPSRTVNVRCVPSGLYLNPSPVTTSSNRGAVLVLPAAISPDTLQPIAYQNPRAGVGPISISLVNPNPDFAAFTVTSVTIDAFSTLSVPSGYFNPIAFSFQTTGAGSADVTFATTSSFAFIPSNIAHIQAAGPALSLFVPLMARDLAAQVFASYPVSGSSVPITFTSSDPAKVRLMADPSQPGQASVTLNTFGTSNSAQPWIEVLDTSGPVSITASTPGADPVTTSVTFGILKAALFQYSQPTRQIALTAGQSTTLQVQLFLIPVYPYYGPNMAGYQLRKNADPIQVQIATSDPSIAAAPTFTLQLAVPSGGFQPFPLPVTPGAPGTAVWSTRVLSGAAVPLGLASVAVSPGGLSVSGSSVGANLMGTFIVSLAGKSDSTPVNVNLSVSDPTQALLSTDPHTPGQPSITVAMPYSSSTVYLQSLSGSGTVDITAAATGYSTFKLTVPLVPSGFGWTTTSVTLPQSGFFPAVSGYALDPVTLSPTARQPVRPGLGGSLALQISDPSVATIAPSSMPLASIDGGTSTVAISPVNGGSAQISIVQPPGFTPPAGHGPLAVTAHGPAIGLQPGIIGRNAQAGLGVFVSGWPSSKPLPTIALTSSDPSKLLLSTGAFSLGSGSINVDLSNIQAAYPNSPVYMNAIDGPADVQIVATGPGLAQSTVTVPIRFTGLALGQAYAGGNTLVISTQTPSGAASLNTLVMNSSGGVVGNATLRPGLDSIPVTIDSSNPAVATVPTSPILNSLTASSPVSVQPNSPGQTDLTVVPPPGYLAAPPGAGRTMHVTVNSPAFTIADLAIGRDLQLGPQINVINGAALIPADVDATFTSGDPSKVLLSADSATPGTASVTIHFTRGQNLFSHTVFIQAVDQSGTVPVIISAPGYATSTTNVTLYPTTFAMNLNQSSMSVQSSPAILQLLPVPAISQRPNSIGNFLFRPGVAPVISASASPSGILNISPASAAWPAGARELDFSVQAVGAGTASLALTVPPPYSAPSPLSITATGGSLNVSASTLTVGYNLQDTVNVNIGQPNVNLTVTSSDPSRVLLSASPTVAGQGAVTLSNATSQNVTVYVQALASTGSATLTFSAPGYQNTTSTVQLMSSAVELLSPFSGATLTPLSAPIGFQAKLVPYNPTSGAGSSAETLRPGAAPLNVQVSLSDPSVASATPAQLTFAAGSSTQSFNIQPSAPGSALLSLSVPAGFLDPVSLRQQLLTVVAARATFTAPLTVGKDLVRPTAIALATPVGSTLSLTVTSADPTRLLLANADNPSGAGSISVAISAGSSTSASFTLVGLASSGTVGVTVSGPGLTSTSFVTLEPTGLVFGPPPTSANANSRVGVQVSVYALNPQTLAPDSIVPLRPGILPVAIAIASSNTASIANSSTVFLNAGDSGAYISLTTLAAGSATLTVQTPDGFTTPASGNTLSITVH